MIAILTTSLFANCDQIILQETNMMNGEGGLANNHSGTSMSHENGRNTAATKGKLESTTDHHTAGNLDGGALFVLESKGT